MPSQHAGFHKDHATPVHRKSSRFFPTATNHQEQQSRLQRPYLPDAAGCSHAASPTSASGTGRCQTLGEGGLAWTVEMHLCWRAAARNAANPPSDRGFHTSKGTELPTARTSQGTESWERYNLWVPSHGVAATAFPCQQSRAQALPAGQVFRRNSHAFLPRHASSTTHSLARTLQILAGLIEKGKSVALSRFSPRLLCFLVPQSSVSSEDVIS